MTYEEQNYETLAALVLRLQREKKDESAFSKLYNVLLPYLAFYARSLTHGDKEKSEDLVQETFLSIYKNIETLREPRAIVKWSNQIMLRKYTDQAQKLSNTNELSANETYELLIENTHEVSREYLPEESADLEETRRLVQEMISALPEVQQETLIYRYVEQLSITEIAQIMQCPEATVKSRLRYAEAGIKNQVLQLEKQGTKLYAAGAPLLYLILRQFLLQQGHVEAATAQTMLHAVKQSAGFSAAAAGAETAVSQGDAAAGQAVGAGISVGTSAVLTKIVLGIAVVALAVVGAITVKSALNERPTVQEVPPRESQKVITASSPSAAPKYQLSLDDIGTRIELNRFLSDITEGIDEYGPSSPEEDMISFAFIYSMYQNTSALKPGTDGWQMEEVTARDILQKYFNRTISPCENGPVGENGALWYEDGMFTLKGDRGWGGALIALADGMIPNADGSYTVQFTTYFTMIDFESDADRESYFSLTAGEIREREEYSEMHRQATVGTKDLPNAHFYLISLGTEP